jgi:hypothetical protein
MPQEARAYAHQRYRAYYTTHNFENSLSIGCDILFTTTQHGQFFGQVHSLGYINPTDSTVDLYIKGYWTQDASKSLDAVHLIVNKNNLSWFMRSRWTLRHFFWWCGSFILPPPEIWLQDHRPMPLNVKMHVQQEVHEEYVICAHIIL